MPRPKSYWFPAKRYGWGWGPPVTWAGWIVLIAFMLAGPVGIIRIGPQNPLKCALFALSMIALLLVVCWLKGEPPRWRRGERDTPGG